MCFTWCSGNKTAFRFQAISVFLLLFFSFFLFTFSFRFNYCSLVLVSLYSLRFFYIINFLYHCLNSCDSRISSNNNNSWAWSVWVPVDVNFLHVFCQIVGFLGEILAYQEFLHGKMLLASKLSTATTRPIVILTSKIVPSSSDHCDLDFVGNTHKEAQGWHITW